MCKPACSRTSCGWTMHLNWHKSSTYPDNVTSFCDGCIRLVVEHEVTQVSNRSIGPANQMSWIRSLHSMENSDVKPTLKPSLRHDATAMWHKGFSAAPSLKQWVWLLANSGRLTLQRNLPRVPASTCIEFAKQKCMRHPIPHLQLGQPQDNLLLASYRTQNFSSPENLSASDQFVNSAVHDKDCEVASESIYTEEVKSRPSNQVCHLSTIRFHTWLHGKALQNITQKTIWSRYGPHM